MLRPPGRTLGCPTCQAHPVSDCRGCRLLTYKHCSLPDVGTATAPLGFGFGASRSLYAVDDTIGGAGMARARKTPSSTEEFKCPECGRTFSRAAALGAHRRQAHGVVGTSNRASSTNRGKRRTTTATARATRTRAGSASRRGPSSARTRVTASSDGRRRTRATADRDALLKALFPNGIPPREDVIRAVNVWLDEAERLARMA
jgi:C2H2-type zinc finger